MELMFLVFEQKVNYNLCWPNDLAGFFNKLETYNNDIASGLQAVNLNNLVI